MTTTLLTLCHALVWVYWLGGDLGAFCASFYATDPARPPRERMLALELVNVVDTAPNIALVLMLPTGLSLAMSAGWLPVSLPLLTMLWMSSLAWLWLSLRVHRSPGPTTQGLARIDTVVRITVIGVLAVIGCVAIAAWWRPSSLSVSIPLFLGMKCLILALATFFGLRIRPPLREFVAAFSKLTPQTDAVLEHRLRRSMNRCRYWVVAIWVCLILAALIGIWRPV
jgi:hypothetical protein